MPDINEGDCFLIETNKYSDGQIKSHLMVTVIKTGARLVLLPICSDNGGKYVDKTCLLKQGCHPFVNKQSFVSYAEARFYNEQDILERLRDGTCKKKSRFDVDTFRRIRQGIGMSDAIPIEIFEVYDDQRFGRM